ncbi:hypothetical protein [Streptomyces sp. NPDC059819]|uniref:hypothetical protein n=1 Tax=Streptomyces sp. NPDC059819 TaxID=3346963 RepID=UPI00364DA4FB
MFLTFFEPPADGWHVRRDDLLDRLSREWPDARLVPSAEMGKSEMRDVGWTYDSSEETVECWSAQSGDGISLDGDEGMVVQFVSWFRRLVPREIDVTFCDDMYSFSLMIPPGSSPGDVLRMYSETA